MSNNNKADKLLKQYEKSVSEKKFELHPNFTVKVMQAVEKEQSGFFGRLYMEIINARRVVVSLSVICLVVLVLLNSDIAKISHTKITDSKISPPPSRIMYNDTRPTNSIAAIVKNLTAPVQEGLFLVEKESALKDTLDRKQFENSLPGATNFIAPNMPWDGSRSYDTHKSLTSYQDSSTDKFYGYEEQGRILTSTNNKSTFSIDVDTGSYTFSRRLLKLGQKPNKDAIRTEEFLNYFDYNYPKQNEEPFSLYYEIAPAAFDKGRHLLMLGVSTKAGVEKRKPWNLTFLIDTSGSMTGEDRLGLVKRSLIYLLQNMTSQDKVSIVTYAGSAGILLEGSSIEKKEEIIRAINSLSSEGSTYGSAGIELAYEVNRKNSLRDGVNRVILATDGDFNVGISSRDELIKFIEEKRKTGITLSAIGVGQGNYNDAALEQIANKGNGNYFYLDSFEEARKVFGSKLASSIETVAKDVKLQIEFNPEHVLEYRLIGYDNRKLENEDFTNDKVDAGEIGVGHTVTALYEIVLKDSPLASKLDEENRYNIKKVGTSANTEKPSELAFLKLRYKEPEENKSKLLSFPILKEKVVSDLDSSSNNFRFASSVYYFASLLKDSKYVSDYSFKDVQSLAKDSLGKDTNEERLEFFRLIGDVVED